MKQFVVDNVKEVLIGVWVLAFIFAAYPLSEHTILRKIKQILKKKF
jgi:hypothetical protein